MRASLKTAILAIQLITLATFGAAPSFAQETASKVDQLIEATWKDVQPKGSGWRYRVSPPFPVSWPASKDAPIVFYVFATKLDPRHIMDGEHVAAPWAEIELDPKDTASPKITIKKKRLVDLGIQGVRPLSKEETAAYKTMDIAQDAVISSSGKKNAVIRSAYCAWIKNNSVIFRQIEPVQRSFFDWLECK